MPLWNKQFEVIAIDLPGHGKSKLSAEPTLESFAEDLKDTFDKLGLRKAAIIGHSLGGYLAQAFAERYPERVLGISLFHSTAAPDTDERKEGRDRVIKYVTENGLDTFARGFVPPLFAPDSREAMRTEIDKMVARVAKANPEGVIAATEAMRERKDRISVLSEYTFPVQFIVGKNDGAVPLDHILEQVSLPLESHVLILDHCGHMGMIEKPTETARAVADFATRCYAPS